MNEQLKIQISSEVETEKLAKMIAKALRGGESVGLKGDLGAGKTTFSRYLIRALGITDPVSSPTFVLSHEYAGKPISIEHWDLYRLTSLPEELYEPQIASVVRLIEWPDRIANFIDSLDLLIDIKVPGESDLTAQTLTEKRTFCLTGKLIPHLQIAFKHGTCR